MSSRQTFLITFSVVCLTLWGGTLQAEEQFLDGKELGPYALVQVVMKSNGRAAALAKCDEILASQSGNRYVRLMRAEIYDALGDLSKARRDLDHLLKAYPDFGPSYLARARLFLKEAMPEKGEHPISAWLRSGDKRKQDAAVEAVVEALQEVQEARQTTRRGTSADVLSPGSAGSPREVEKEGQ